MPIQAPQWTDYLNCPVCCREFGAPPRSPVSLGCGHTLCRQCLNHLHRKQCPFDQTVIQVEQEELVVNTALLQLAGIAPPAQPYHPPCIQALPEAERLAYDVVVRCCESLAVYLKFCGNANNNNNNTASNRLSRPMQRKLVTLLQCAVTDEEGRGRAARAARSLGERTVTELILQHQNPQQLSANLWAAVRARGCQFLGPAMQEEVLKLVLLALEDGSALSRKVLVMFVVQRLEPHFPQASKTSIGHVVQLLYRASCFKVSKRECDSSLMQLKDEFRTYESLRREHDAQIVQIATEAGLRVAPDQWSALLYGDTTHKSHMQSIIDKLQTPQSFAQSVQELFIALQRTGDPAQLVVMSTHLEKLSNIEVSADLKSPTWQELAEITTSLKEVVSGLVQYLQLQATGRDSNHNHKHAIQDRTSDQNNSLPSPQMEMSTPTHTKYKVLMCRDAANRSFCPRGAVCTFAHSEEELERYRNGSNSAVPTEDMPYVSVVYTSVSSSPPHQMQPVHSQHMYPNYPQPNYTMANSYLPQMQSSMQPPIQPQMQLQVQPQMQPAMQPGMQPAMQPAMHPPMPPTMQHAMQPLNQPPMQPPMHQSMPPSMQHSMQLSMQQSMQQSMQAQMHHGIPVNREMQPHNGEYDNSSPMRRYHRVMPNQPPLALEPNGVMLPPVPVWQHAYVYRDDNNDSVHYPDMYRRRAWGPPRPLQIVYHDPANMYMPGLHSPYEADEASAEASYPYYPRENISELQWQQNNEQMQQQNGWQESPDTPFFLPEQQWHGNNENPVYYNMDQVRNALPGDQNHMMLSQGYELEALGNNQQQGPTMPAHMFSVPGDRPAVGADRLAEFVDRIATAGVFDFRNGNDGYQNPRRLVEKLQALERGLLPEKQ